MKKSKTGYFIVASAIVWGAVLIGCGLVLKGTPYNEKVSFIIMAGIVIHLLVLWIPFGNQLRIKNDTTSKTDHPDPEDKS
ncbi:hypothetical protein ES705_26405 [subsurface metagenome]